MSLLPGIERVPFSEAKSNFSGFVSDVVRKHALRVLDRGRGQEQLLAIPVEDLLRGLAACRLDALVSAGERSLIARLPRFGLVASGDTFERAIDALHDELVDYCEDFFSDFDFYRHTSRIAHLPFLLRFALTPPDDRRALLLEEPAEESAAAAPEVSSAPTR